MRLFADITLLASRMDRTEEMLNEAMKRFDTNKKGPADTEPIKHDNNSKIGKS